MTLLNKIILMHITKYVLANLRRGFFPAHFFLLPIALFPCQHHQWPGELKKNLKNV